MTPTPIPSTSSSTGEDYLVRLRHLIHITVAAIPNANTRRAYLRYLRQFARLKLPLTKVGVLDYLGRISRPTVRQLSLSAIRKLVRVAESDGLISIEVGYSIRSIPRPKSRSRLGRWLTLEGAKSLVSLPNYNTLIGCRDGAIFALTLGCGLRRFEAAAIHWDALRLVNDRYCLVDILGKGDKYRTVPVPAWAMEKLDLWRARIIAATGFPEIALDGPILRRLWQGHPARLSTPITPTGINLIIKSYSSLIGTPFSAHDLRRTLAQLMRRAGVPIEQVQFTLGHDSTRTTELYLGGAIVLTEGQAGVDKIPW